MSRGKIGYPTMKENVQRENLVAYDDKKYLGSILDNQQCRKTCIWLMEKNKLPSDARILSMFYIWSMGKGKNAQQC
jgi:hypothetical protein